MQNSNFYKSEECADLYEKLNKDNSIIAQKYALEDFISNRFKDEVIINNDDRTVKYVIKQMCNYNKPFIGQARCHIADEFNEEIGKEIASKRALIKKNKKTISRLKEYIKYTLEKSIENCNQEIRFYNRYINRNEQLLNNIKNELNEYLNKCYSEGIKEDEKINYPLNPKSLIVNFKIYKNKVVKCILKTCEYGEKYKGVSVCHEDDIFDIEIGKTIAYKRALIKLLKKRIRHCKLYIKYNENYIKAKELKIKQMQDIIKHLEKRNNKLLNDIKKY